jgi:hypothetical protein
MDQEPASKQCPECNSYQISECRIELGDRVSLALRCNACKRRFIFWTGTRIEERAFKRRRRGVKRRMDAAARKLSGDGAG